MHEPVGGKEQPEGRRRQESAAPFKGTAGTADGVGGIVAGTGGPYIRLLRQVFAPGDTKSFLTIAAMDSETVRLGPAGTCRALPASGCPKPLRRSGCGAKRYCAVPLAYRVSTSEGTGAPEKLPLPEMP